MRHTASQSMTSKENFAATRDGTMTSKVSSQTGDRVLIRQLPPQLCRKSYFFFVSDLKTFMPFREKITYG